MYHTFRNMCTKHIALLCSDKIGETASLGSKKDMQMNWKPPSFLGVIFLFPQIMKYI